MKNKPSKLLLFFLILNLLIVVFLSMLFLGGTSAVLAQAENTPTPEFQARIVGGMPADPGEWPWQVALVKSDSPDSYPYFWYGQFCGGSLIDPSWVLTAAHCVTESNGSVSNPASIDVVAGIYNILNPEPGYQRRDVALIVRYPFYNDNNLDHDLALIKLSSPVTLGGGPTSTSLVALAPSSIGSLTGRTSWVTGWGKISTTPTNYAPELYEVDLPIISNSTCSSWWAGITAGNICAGNGTGKDSCSGDSGGPLVIYENGEWVQVGIVSSGASACGTYPGIYTRVSYYANWVNAYVTPPEVASITRLSADPTNASLVYFKVTFSDVTTGVDVSDFMVSASGVSGAFVTAVNSSETNSYTVTVNTGSGDGTIRLDVVDDDTILGSNSIPLGGIGGGNGNFTLGEIYTVDKTAPEVSLITRVGFSPNTLLLVGYQVVFPEPVSGVDPSDFTLTATGISNASITGVSGSGTNWMVNVNTGFGSGTLRLDFVSNGSVQDSAGNPASLDFVSGETYTINKPKLPAPVLRSPRSGGALNNPTPTFHWRNVNRAQNYEIQFAADSGFTSGLASDMTSGMSYTPADPFVDGTYYWRVRAYDVSGQAGLWSRVQKITIDTTGPTAPVLVSPADTFISLNRTPVFRWQAVSGAAGYEFRYDNDADCQSPLYSAVLRTTSRKPPVMSAGTYYWCVRARDRLGNWGDWSSPFTITIP
jgi:secreted trypsin-like serine protease